MGIRKFADCFAVFVLSLSACISLSTSASANSGNVTVALPVSGISIDGDISDWPNSIPHHEIRRNHYGDAPNSDGDLSAFFKVGYDLEAHRLLVVVQIRDDSLVLHTPGAAERWNSRDGAGIHISVNHGSDGKPVYDAMAFQGADAPRAEHLEARHKRQGNVHTYEWGIDLQPYLEKVDVEQPYTIAFCVHATDMDEDGSISIRYWSPHAWKTQASSRAGDLLLNVDTSQLAILDGHILPRPDGSSFGAQVVRYSNISNPNLVADVMTDSQGYFKVQLPHGRYRRTVRDASGFESEIVTVEGTRIVDQFMTPPSRDTNIPLGPGSMRPLKLPRHERLEDLNNDTATYRTSQYTVANGLPSGVNWDLVVDEQGRIWTANGMGLVEISGGQTTTYDKRDGLPTSKLSTLLLGKDRLWIGGHGGLAYLTLSTRMLTIVDELEGQMIFELNRLHDGRVGVCTANGLFAVDGDVVVPYGKPDGLWETRTLSCFSDPLGNFTWIGTDDGLCRFDGSRFTNYETPASSLPDNRIWSIASDRNGRMWFGANRSIFVFDRKNYHTLRTTAHETYKHCSSITQGPSGIMWATTRLDNGEPGVMAFAQSMFDPMTHIFPVPAYNVTRDAYDNIWLSGSGFVSQLDLKRTTIAEGHIKSLSIAPESDGHPETVWAATWDGDDWFLSSIKKEGGTFKRRKFEADGRINTLLKHARHADRVWVGTNQHGLQLFDGKAFVYPDQQDSDTVEDANHIPWPDSTFVLSLLERSTNQDLWCATPEGIYVIRDDRVHAFYNSHSGLKETARIDGFAECADGRIACATLTGVLFLDPDTGTVIGKIDTADGLPDNQATCVEASRDGSVWIGTHDGLYCYRDTTLTYIGRSRGLLNSKIDGIREDAHGILWISTAMGVAKLDPQTEMHQAIVEPTSASPPEQFLAVGFGQHDTWIGSTIRLTRCTNTLTRPGLQYGDTVTDRTIRRDEEIVTNTDVDSITFSYRAVSPTTDQAEFRYRWRLAGFSDEWTTTPDRFVELSTPPIGEYELQIYAYDRDLNESELLTIPFKVTIPYGLLARTWLTIASCAACILFGLLYTIKMMRDNRELEIRVRERTEENLQVQKEKTQLRDELMHAQKMESLGTMAAGLAHDFNNTLSAIVSNAEVALLRINQPENVRHSLNAVMSASEQAAGLTKSLLTFAGKTNTETNPVNMQRLLRSSLDMVRGALPAAVQVHLDLTDDPVWCNLDAGQMNQVLINLLMNARDALEGGGNVFISLRKATQPEQPKLAADPSAHVAIIRISDDGIGMDPVSLARAFEPFYTTKARGEGTGLGLSIAHSIVTSHHGKISVDSNVGYGTAFEIHLPTCIPTRQETRIVEPTSMPFLDGLRVLVADDENRVREALSGMLQSAGANVSAVADGQALVETALAHLSEISLIVADIDMPHKSGTAAVAEIRQHAPGFPVIFITGMPTQQPTDFDASTTAFLRKPFRMSELLELASGFATHRQRPADSDDSTTRSGEGYVTAPVHGPVRRTPGPHWQTRNIDSQQPATDSKRDRLQ